MTTRGDAVEIDAFATGGPAQIVSIDQWQMSSTVPVELSQFLLE